MKIFRVRSPRHKTGEMEEKLGCQDLSGKKLSVKQVPLKIGSSHGHVTLSSVKRKIS